MLIYSYMFLYDMIKTNNDRLPKWVSLALVLSALIAVMVIGYVWHHPQKTTSIGTTERLTEKIDQDLVQKAYSWSDVIPAHPPFEIVQKSDKTLTVFMKLNIEPSGRMTIHCNWDSCNIRNATNYVYDTLIEDGYLDNQTVKIMVNNGFQVFNGTVYDLRG